MHQILVSFNVFMKKIIFTAVLTAAASVAAYSQTEKPKPAVAETPKVETAKVETPKDASLELAKKAVEFHGGAKFLGYKTLIVRGTSDVSVDFGGQTQTFAGSFVMTLAGDRYRFELNTPIRTFKQTYDGENTVSSEPSITLPPINRLGLPLLRNYSEKGYVVSELSAELKKKKTGFRITAPDGFFTDYFVDEKTGEVKGYASSYDFNGRSVSTSVEIDKLRDVEGVKLEEKYSQRFELGITFYSLFKAKEIILNAPIADEVFGAPKAK